MKTSEPKPADFIPNYKKKCMVCGSKPTVDIHTSDGSKKINTEMCGACTWGEAELMDPEEW